MLVSCSFIPAPGGCPCLGMFPPEFPDVLAAGRNVRLLQTEVVPFLIELLSGLNIAVVDANPCSLIRHFAFLVKGTVWGCAFLCFPVVDDKIFVFSGLFAIPFKGP